MKNVAFNFDVESQWTRVFTFGRLCRRSTDKNMSPSATQTHFVVHFWIFLWAPILRQNILRWVGMCVDAAADSFYVKNIILICSWHLLKIDNDQIVMLLFRRTLSSKEPKIIPIFHIVISSLFSISLLFHFIWPEDRVHAFRCFLL